MENAAPHRTWSFSLSPRPCAVSAVIRVPCRRAALNRCMRSTGYGITWKSTQRLPSQSKRCTMNTSECVRMHESWGRSPGDSLESHGSFSSPFAGAIVTISATIHWARRTLERSWRMSFPTWKRVDLAWGANPNILFIPKICSTKSTWCFQLGCNCFFSSTHSRRTASEFASQL